MKKALFTSKIRLACGTAAILLAVPAMAQEAAPDAEATESAPADDASIIVTGTRVNREGYLAPTPVTAIGRDAIEAQAATTIADVLYDIPSVRPSPNFPATSQASGNYVNLRGLGATRTLTLVDGRRFVPSNGAENSGGSSVDINLIPEALVDRLDVVSGGASAAWGSDAVGGVINIVLKRKLEGIQGKVQYGVSDYGDAQEVSLSLAAGTSFADGRGQLMLAGEYSKSWDVPTTNDRPYGKDQCGWFPGSVNGTFYLGLQTCGLTHNSYTRGGVLVAANGNPLASTDPFYGRQFLNSTSSAPFDYGQVGPINRSVSIGGDGEWRGVRNLQAPLERKILFGRALYEFSPSLTGFIEASYGESGTETDLFLNAIPSSTDYPIAIRNGNPYIPADIQAIMNANGTDTIYLSKLTPELVEGLWHLRARLVRHDPRQQYRRLEPCRRNRRRHQSPDRAARLPRECRRGRGAGRGGLWRGRPLCSRQSFRTGVAGLGEGLYRRRSLSKLGLYAGRGRRVDQRRALLDLGWSRVLRGRRRLSL